ncbi:alpha-D-ribose 1-methylphosphonate 5-triphosphate diphosphatase [Meridianimarinicoccus roseus]|uniref:Alpha-D-ribose 1-methylphosphonate 5-triphosphate diphosphatase n=1 Tax=Meridianimarinicoccus roseus TaxID=2072018 RepID=A0A2V2LHK3_9RHOB|nr:alpha-D-ribose 1-methylphosphonate 5-triphosphate diphosphatase [Meridianimarinicoccus roseus]PWR01879.1 alpha-D-ribose 1-methylphosphonate 5-triphosphate diphosphatase [Meridianimarinicoccus roseus]
MTPGLDLDFHGAAVLRPDGLDHAPLCVADGRIVEGASGGRRVDLTGWTICPGIVDIHGDGFERHVAVRRGALPAMDEGVLATEAELAANGITTALLAQFFSWEGGMRGPDFAARLVAAWQAASPRVATDLRLQLRLETHVIDDFPQAEALIEEGGIGHVVFNDHLPHDRLAAGRTPPRLTGQALKSGRSPEAHLALLRGLEARSAEVPQAVTALAARLLKRGVRIGSHDDRTPADRAWYRAIGAHLSEFPETLEVAGAARAAGDGIVMGAPNVVRGASHAGKVSAREVVAAGLCDALASDYHYPAPRLAVRALTEAGICDVVQAWRLVSEGPARLMGLTDRGRIAEGLRADLVILKADTGRIGGTMAGGRFTYLATPLAERLIA